MASPYSFVNNQISSDGREQTTPMVSNYYGYTQPAFRDDAYATQVAYASPGLNTPSSTSTAMNQMNLQPVTSTVIQQHQHNDNERGVQHAAFQNPSEHHNFGYYGNDSKSRETGQALPQPYQQPKLQQNELIQNPFQQGQHPIQHISQYQQKPMQHQLNAMQQWTQQGPQQSLQQTQLPYQFSQQQQQQEQLMHQFPQQQQIQPQQPNNLPLQHHLQQQNQPQQQNQQQNQPPLQNQFPQPHQQLKQHPLSQIPPQQQHSMQQPLQHQQQHTANLQQGMLHLSNNQNQSNYPMSSELPNKNQQSTINQHFQSQAVSNFADANASRESPRVSEPVIYQGFHRQFSKDATNFQRLPFPDANQNMAVSSMGFTQYDRRDDGNPAMSVPASASADVATYKMPGGEVCSQGIPNMQDSKLHLRQGFIIPHSQAAAAPFGQPSTQNSRLERNQTFAYTSQQNPSIFPPQHPVYNSNFPSNSISNQVYQGGQATAYSSSKGSALHANVSIAERVSSGNGYPKSHMPNLLRQVSHDSAHGPHSQSIAANQGSFDNDRAQMIASMGAPTPNVMTTDYSSFSGQLQPNMSSSTYSQSSSRQNTGNFPSYQNFGRQNCISSNFKENVKISNDLSSSPSASTQQNCFEGHSTSFGQVTNSSSEYVLPQGNIIYNAAHSNQDLSFQMNNLKIQNAPGQRISSMQNSANVERGGSHNTLQPPPVQNSLGFAVNGQQQGFRPNNLEISERIMGGRNQSENPSFQEQQPFPHHKDLYPAISHVFKDGGGMLEQTKRRQGFEPQNPNFNQPIPDVSGQNTVLTSVSNIRQRSNSTDYSGNSSGAQRVEQTMYRPPYETSGAPREIMGSSANSNIHSNINRRQLPKQDSIYQRPYSQIPSQMYNTPAGPGGQPIVIMPGYSSSVVNSRPTPSNFEPRIEAILEHITDKQGPSHEKLKRILIEILNLQDDVFSFKGRRGDRNYIQIEEMLTRQLLALDGIQSHGNEELRLTRKSTVRQVQGLIATLESRAKT